MSEILEHESREDYQKISWGPREEYIPLDWDLKNINEISKNVIYPQRDKPKDLEGEVPWIRIEDLDGKYISESDSGKGVTRETIQEMNLSVFPSGTLMCSCSGNMGICAITERELISNQTFAGIVPSENVDIEYLYYCLENLKDDLQRMSTGTTIPYLSSDKLKRFSVPYPSLPEQHRIVDILSTVDEQIQQTDEMIQSLRDLKDGLSQDVFDVQTTKEDADGEAEKEILRDFVEVISGTHVKSALVSADESKTPYITGPDDFENRGFQVTKYTDDPPSFCEPEDTLVTVKGSGCGASTFANRRAGISRQLKALRPTEHLDSRYLYYWIQTKESLLSILAQGTSIPGLSTTDLTTLQIPLPPLEKQEYIGEIFSTVDSRLDGEREQKQHLQDLKRGLMQDLLTGKVRVDAD
jgi:type I restriction enzyme S subunit